MLRLKKKVGFLNLHKKKIKCILPSFFVNLRPNSHMHIMTKKKILKNIIKTLVFVGGGRQNRKERNNYLWDRIFRRAQDRIFEPTPYLYFQNFLSPSSTGWANYISGRNWTSPVLVRSTYLWWDYKQLKILCVCVGLHVKSRGFTKRINVFELFLVMCCCYK